MLLTALSVPLPVATKWLFPTTHKKNETMKINNFGLIVNASLTYLYRYKCAAFTTSSRIKIARSAIKLKRDEIVLKASNGGKSILSSEGSMMDIIIL